MKLNNYIISGFVALMGVAGTSCTGDLDLKPNEPNLERPPLPSGTASSDVFTATCTATT